MNRLRESNILRALLVGDRRFIRVGGTVFTEGPSGPETGERYLRLFEEVTVAGRAGDAAGVDVSRLNRLDEAGLAVETLPNLSGAGAILRNQRAARSRLEQLIGQHDAVICRMPTQLGLLALQTGLRLGKPVAADLGGCAYDGQRAHGSVRGWLYAPLSYRRVKAVIAKCQWVSYVTQHYLQARYPASPGAKTVACSNVDVPDVPAAILTGRLDRDSGNSNGLVFGTIGSLHTKYKGIQHAFAALGRLRNELPVFQYRVLGGGDQRPWVTLAARHGLQDNIHFDGTLPAGQRVFDWLDSIDVYLHPSLTEGVPRAVIEAMSRGCPVIASNVGGTPELLPAEVLHDPGDVDCLCELLRLVKDPGFREAAARRNFEAARKYSRKKLLARRDEFWGAFAEAARQHKAIQCRA